MDTILQIIILLFQTNERKFLFVSSALSHISCLNNDHRNLMSDLSQSLVLGTLEPLGTTENQEKRRKQKEWSEIGTTKSEPSVQSQFSVFREYRYCSSIYYRVSYFLKYKDQFTNNFNSSNDL